MKADPSQTRSTYMTPLIHYHQCRSFV